MFREKDKIVYTFRLTVRLQSAILYSVVEKKYVCSCVYYNKARSLGLSPISLYTTSLYWMRLRLCFVVFYRCIINFVHYYYYNKTILPNTIIYTFFTTYIMVGKSNSFSYASVWQNLNGKQLTLVTYTTLFPFYSK